MEIEEKIVLFLLFLYLPKAATINLSPHLFMVQKSQQIGLCSQVHYNGRMILFNILAEFLITN
jgi:hypothetical protein